MKPREIRAAMRVHGAEYDDPSKPKLIREIQRRDSRRLKTALLRRAGFNRNIYRAV